MVDAAPFEHRQLVRGDVLEGALGDITEVKIGIDRQLVLFHLR